MSTEMKGTTRHQLTRFYGGEDRGVCLQATLRVGTGPYLEGYITVNKTEALELADALLKFYYETLEEEEC